MENSKMSYAKKSHVRISRRKVARLGNECVKKKVGVVLHKLGMLPQPAAHEIKQVIKSAAANYLVKNPNQNTDELLVDNVIIDMGPSFKRMLPRARGSADTIKRRSCHIKVYLKG